MGKTASVMLGRGSLAHNNRAFFTENVDPALTPDNITFVKQKLRDAYQEIFGDALERYNQKQKRNDRKIPDYYEHIRQSKNGEKLYQELVVQVGNRCDTGIGSPDAETAKDILSQYYHDFVSRNPNMRVFNAVLHMDEPDGTPHLHINFIPIATGQKRGLETKNSMRQALQQQGFDFQPTYVVPNAVSASYGEKTPNIGGGRWLDAERAALGNSLKQRGISWDKQGAHREHLSVSEYKACAEIVEKKIRDMPPTELEPREPNRAMRLAGVKADEVIASRFAIETLQQENTVLRAQAELDRAAKQAADREKASFDAHIQRVYKAAAEKERQADALQARYSQGIAENYQALGRKYAMLFQSSAQLKRRCDAAEQSYHKLEAAIPEQVKTAVDEATRPLQEESSRLQSELERWQQKAVGLQAAVHNLCQTIHDIMRAVFTLKYSYQDKSPNPYKSELTEHASHLIDALEHNSRSVLQDVGETELVKGIDGMEVSASLEKDVRAHMPRQKSHGYEIGE